MSKIPPHLPPKASSRKQYEMFQSVPWILFFVTLCGITAFAVSTVLFAWYIPTYVSYQYPTSAPRINSTVDNGDIHPLFAKELESRMFTLYAGNIGAPPENLSSEIRLTEAVSVSSDGAIAFLMPDAPKHMIAVSREGAVYEVRDVRTDAISNIQYATVIGDGFQVTPFATASADEVLYIESKGVWSTHSLSNDEAVQDETSFFFHLPLQAYTLEAPNGAQAYDVHGNFAGFVLEGRLVPSFWIQYSLSDVLSGDSFVHASYPYQVRHIERVFDMNQFAYKSIQGLEVVASAQRASDSSLVIGDIITQVDGEAVDIVALAEYVQSKEALTLKVLRDGDEIDITL